MWNGFECSRGKDATFYTENLDVSPLKWLKSSYKGIKLEASCMENQARELCPCTWSAASAGAQRMQGMRFPTASPALINTVQCGTIWNAKAIPSGDHHWVDLSPKWTWANSKKGLSGTGRTKHLRASTYWVTFNLLLSLPGLEGWPCPKL